jgi:hypothetical protein
MDRTVIGDKLINDAGIYPDVKGFTYIIDAVETFKPGKSTLMDVYAGVAEKHGVAPSNVEKCIRHAKEGSKRYGHLNNGQFIGLLKWELEKETK